MVMVTILESIISETQNLCVSSFLPKCSKFNLAFKNAAKKKKKIEKVFCFWDNCISIGIFKFSLLREGYLSSPPNVFRSSPKIWCVNKRDFL